MRRRMLLVQTVAVCTIVLVGCSNAAEQSTGEQLFKANPTTITWSEDDGSKGITSFQTDVEVYSMNNRKDTSLKMTGKYSMAVKLIDNVQYTRIDMDADSTGTKRSIITNGSELIVCNAETNEVLTRMPMSDDATSNLRLLSDKNLGFGSVDMATVRSEAARLAFDVAEEADGALFTLSLPASYLPKNEGEKFLSSKISYDTNNETVNNEETVSVLDDGSKVTSTLCPVYEEYDGEQVKVGTILTIDTVVPEPVGVMEDTSDTYESLDDIPEISADDLKKMQNTGSVFENNTMTFGNPADLSSTETVVERYADVTINNTDDSVFKLLLEGE